MATPTPRLNLPRIAAGQMQKEVTHNDALSLIDALVAPLVESVGQNVPPPAAAPGQAWVTGNAPTGAWTGQADRVAVMTEGGWRFAAIPARFEAVVASNGARWRRSAGGWTAPVALNDPAGGTTVDGECRTALSAVIAVLRAHGFATE